MKPKTFLRSLMCLFLLVLCGLSVAGWMFWANKPEGPGPDGRPILMLTAVASLIGLIVMVVTNRDEAADGR